MFYSNHSILSIANLIGIIHKYGWKKVGYDYFSTFLTANIRFVMMLYLAWTVYKGINTIGDFAAILSAAFTLSVLLSNIMNLYPNLHQHSLFIVDIISYLKKEPKTEVNDMKICQDLFQSEIKFENVIFQYAKEGDPTLNNINLSIKMGHHVAIVGKNGVGKSTIIKLLLGLYYPKSGNIYLDGVKYADIDPKYIRNKIGVVFQDFQVYPLTIAENILMREINDTVEDEELVWDALNKCGLAEKVRSLPNNIYTSLTNEFEKEGVSLSGGELQKLALARVLIKDYDVIILDEPSSAMDPISEQDILGRIIELMKGKTLIIVSHRFSFLYKLNQIHVMESGKIIESGTHDELIASKGSYAESYLAQTRENHENVLETTM